MKYHWLDKMDGLIIEGDIIAALAQLEDESVEAIVTDPPYDLLQGSRRGSGRSNNPDSPAGRHGTKTGGFMGMAWDATGVAFLPETWEACLRVLKPGGHLVVFGGTRTHHRMWVAIEDAGFEVRDMLLWMYGQGFPKSLDVSKAIDKAAGADRERLGVRSSYRPAANAVRDPKGFQDRSDGFITAPATDGAKKWDGWGTALKPACEPILLARKPLSEKTVAANVLKHGTGALNIDATRIGAEEMVESRMSQSVGGAGVLNANSRDVVHGNWKQRPNDNPAVHVGRWPANVMLQCTCDDPQPLPEKARKRRGEPSQEQRYDKEGVTNFAAKPGTRREGGGFIHEPDCPAGMLDAQTGILKSGMMQAGQQRNKTKGGGGYHGNMPDEATAVGTYGDAGGASRFFYCPKATKKERGEGNNHPTVKPLALMRYLVRLVTPPDGVVLDPFCGSGSTLVAATEEGFGFIGVDLNGEYCGIALQRLKGRKA